MGDDNEVIRIEEIIRRGGVIHERRGTSQPLSKSSICEEEERAAQKPDKGPQRQEESWERDFRRGLLERGGCQHCPMLLGCHVGNGLRIRHSPERGLW